MAKSLAEVLNKNLNVGDAVTIRSGADFIVTGTFLRAADNFMVISEPAGVVSFWNLGDSINVEKV